MLYKIVCFVSGLLLLSSAQIFAQKNIVSVDKNTGTGSVYIPLYSFSNGGASVPVGISYSANGVRVKDVEGKVGMNWHLSAGGGVYRQLRGLPDDVKKDNAPTPNSREGWLYNTEGTTGFPFFTILNNGSDCNNETSDFSSFSSYIVYDTEPDIFSVSAPGLSCSFVFGNDRNIRTIPYQDLKIEYTANSTTGLIETFTVTNNKGTVYHFTEVNASVKQTALVPVTGLESNIVYFKTNYTRYKYGISYNSAWYLTSVVDVTGNAVTLTYSNDNHQSSADPVSVYIGGSTTKLILYYNQVGSQPKLVSAITGANGGGTFAYFGNYDTGHSFLSQFSLPGWKYIFNYDNVQYDISSTNHYDRYFLRDVLTDQCNSPVNYHFNYIGESVTSGRYTTVLPDSTSNKIDFWGYYTATSSPNIIPGVYINGGSSPLHRYTIATDANTRTNYAYNAGGGSTARAADPTAVKTGTLNLITYNDGGTTAISYESNDYIDAETGTTTQGGGIRVASVTDYDGVSTSNNIVRSYSYTDPGTTYTSGKPISLPQYAFTRPYDTSTGTTANNWTYSTVLSEDDLSEEDHTILYSRVKESVTNSGYTRYEYDNPAMNWDTSVSDWSTTLIYAGRTTCPSSLGYLTNGTNMYPFTPHLNFDFERGLLKKAIAYTSSNVLVSESAYTYQRSYTTPVTITGFRFDDNSTAKSYGQYKIYAATSELISQVDTKIYDPSAAYQTTTVNSTYGSSYHKMMTQQQTTNSDGTVLTQLFKYIGDYPVTSSATGDAAYLYKLKQKNINQLVETISQVQRGSGATKTIGASLVRFGDFPAVSGTNTLPAQQLVFKSVAGTTGFTPSSATSTTFSYDNTNYVVAANNVIYDKQGFIQTANDNNRHVQTSLGSNYTHSGVAVVSNASANEVAVMNFDNTVDNANFVKSSSPYNYITGRDGGVSVGLQLESGGIISKTVTKSLTAPYYVFSVWAKAATAGTFTVSVVGTTSTHNYTKSFPTSSDWTYYEMKVPVTDLGTTFATSFSSNVSVAVDDLLFYPSNAQVQTYYNYNQLTLTETNTNGRSNYYTYDNLSRPLLTYNQDHLVTSSKTYHYENANYTLPTPAFTLLYWGVLKTYISLTFSGSNYYSPCIFPGVTYTWNFGDGTISSSSSHTYTTAGTYTVTLTVSASGFTSKSVSTVIDVIAGPPPGVAVHYSEFSSAGVFSSIKFYQGGVLKYNYTKADLDAGQTVIPGSYDIQVYCTGSVYGSVSSSTDFGTICNDYYKTNHYSYTQDLSSATYIDITVSDDICY